MAVLRDVDPRTLVPNPNNPRRTPVPKAMDEQLLASVKVCQLIQPPCVKDVDGTLVIVAGHRRVKAAIAAELNPIAVLVCDADEAADAMRSLSENVVRASMNSVDIWRGIQALEAQGWNEAAIADALALPPRTVKKLKLLAHLLPAMLDCMAAGSMPADEQLRSIAAATPEEQAQVWKKHKPKKGQGVQWWEVARALSKRTMPFTAAKFGDDLATAYGIVWEDDLFAPAGEDGRYTTNVDGFFGAQQEWVQNNLPERAVLLALSEHGQPQLPKKAEPVYGKPAKSDHVGHYVDTRSGEVKTLAYRLPEPKKPAVAKRGGDASGADGTGDSGTDTEVAPAKPRPEVTQAGQAMIGDLRTDALHEALREAEIDDHTLLALLVLAFAGRNVSVHTGAGLDSFDRAAIADTLTEGGALTTDPATLRAAGRSMLTAVLSCRLNMSNSGPLARIAGDTIDASRRLPNMATDDFLACLSKAALERAAAAEGVRVGARGKDTRANLVDHFKDGGYVYPPALFRITAEEAAEFKAQQPRRYVPNGGWINPRDAVASADNPDAEDDPEGDGANADDGNASGLEAANDDAEAGIAIAAE